MFIYAIHSIVRLLIDSTGMPSSLNFYHQLYAVLYNNNNSSLCIQLIMAKVCVVYVATIQAMCIQPLFSAIALCKKKRKCHFFLLLKAAQLT